MGDIVINRTDDEINYRISAHRVLRRRTVQVTVPVELLVGPDEADQAAIEARVREVLARFLHGDWATSSMTRTGASAGYERLLLTASIRVPLEIAFNLEERARAAGMRGISLGEPMLDYRVARSIVAKATSELRKEIVDQVNAQIAQFNEWTGRTWRIGSINLGVPAGAGQRTTKGAYRSEDGLDEEIEYEQDRRGGVERLQIVASVTLRSAVPPSAETC